ncbi:hypothetical protein [Gordonia sp. NPDC003376]
MVGYRGPTILVRPMHARGEGTLRAHRPPGRFGTWIADRSVRPHRHPTGSHFGGGGMTGVRALGVPTDRRPAGAGLTSPIRVHHPPPMRRRASSTPRVPTAAGPDAGDRLLSTPEGPLGPRHPECRAPQQAVDRHVGDRHVGADAYGIGASGIGAPPM